MVPEGSSGRQEEDDGNPCGHGAESAACAPCPRAGGTGVRWRSAPPVWTPSSPHGSTSKHQLYRKLVYGLQKTQGQRNMLHALRPAISKIQNAGHSTGETATCRQPARAREGEGKGRGGRGNQAVKSLQSPVKPWTLYSKKPSK